VFAAARWQTTLAGLPWTAAELPLLRDRRVSVVFAGYMSSGLGGQPEMGQAGL